MKAITHGAHLNELARQHIVGGAQRIVFLIGCGKTKRAEPSRARELYTGALFRKSLELAERAGDATFIVSAQHGLLELDAVIAPYERTLTTARRAEREAWGAKVASALEDRLLGGVARPRVIMLAGAPYVEPVRAELARRPRFLPVVDMLSGMQIGERLSFLNRAIALVKGGHR